MLQITNKQRLSGIKKRENVKEKRESVQNLDTFPFSAFIDLRVYKILRSHLNFDPANIHSPEGQRRCCTI